MPAVGKTFKENDVFGVVESVKAASDLYIPVSGEIVETNTTLVSSPDLINQDAENHWIIKVKISNPAELNQLLSKADYDALPK